MATGGGGATVSRREAFVLGGAAAGVAASAVGGAWVYRGRHAHVPLHSETVAYAAGDRRVLIADPARVQRDSRVTRDASPAPRRRQESFLRAANPWLERVPQEHRDLARSALLDLWVLTDQLPATVAGWSARWRYVWPRDTAFCAAALAQVGHLDRAVAELGHLQGLQHSDGWFEARYRPGSSRPPDGRARQFDGTGLIAWAIAEVHAAAARAGRPLGRELDPMLALSYRTLVKATDGGRALPEPSPDFWEVPEDQCTIGVAACTLAGLVAAGGVLGSPGAGHRFRDVVGAEFAEHGFQRYGSRGGPDAGTAFLDATGVHGLTERHTLTDMQDALRRPAGGIAPGASWKDDGISWTPSTSLLGLAMARGGDHASAVEVLRWLAAHRTRLGSLPEKVLHDDSPAAEAPLSWSAANVLLTLDELLRAD